VLRKWRNFVRRLSPVRYDEGFFTEHWFRNWSELRPVLEAILTHDGRWTRFLDYGCGPGALIDPMNARGYEYFGCELSAEPRRLYLSHYGRYPERYVRTLDAVADRSFDVVVLFDVLEHLADVQISDLLRRIPTVPEMLANISREPSVPGHINIKSDADWLEFFGSRGWRYEDVRTAELRRLYLEHRPKGQDLWHENMFLLSRDPQTFGRAQA
jgi:SAM-dependent methyltransferase